MFRELDESDNDATVVTLEELTKRISNLAVPKGLARTSLMIAFERHTLGKGAPKKTLNRLHYQYIDALLTCKDMPILQKGLDFFHDRLDGRAAQAINLGNHEGNALTLTVAQSDTNVL